MLQSEIFSRYYYQNAIISIRKVNFIIAFSFSKPCVCLPGWYDTQANINNQPAKKKKILLLEFLQDFFIVIDEIMI